MIQTSHSSFYEFIKRMANGAIFVLFRCGRENSCLGMKMSFIKIFDIINEKYSTKNSISIEKTHVCYNKLQEGSIF